MSWQDAGVVIVVAGAVAFLARRLFPAAAPRQGASTFVPLATVRSKARRDPPACH